MMIFVSMILCGKRESAAYRDFIEHTALPHRIIEYKGHHSLFYLELLFLVPFLVADFFFAVFRGADFFFAAFFLAPFFFGGTFAPASRASEIAIAIACLRLVTFLPLPPLLNVPRFFSRITFSILSCAAFEYFFVAMVEDFSAYCAIIIMP